MSSKKPHKSKGTKGHHDHSQDKEQTPVVDSNAFTYSADPQVADVQRKIVGVFDMFDPGNQKIVDVREVGCIVRALDLYPTEADVHEIIENVEEASTRGYVKLERFVTYLTKIILDGVRYVPIPVDTVTQAFKTIDREKKGTIEMQRLRDYLMKEGEPFTQEEVDEMFNCMVSKDDGLFHYEEYIRKAARQ